MLSASLETFLAALDHNPHSTYIRSVACLAHAKRTPAIQTHGSCSDAMRASVSFFFTILASITTRKSSPYSLLHTKILLILGPRSSRRTLSSKVLDFLHPVKSNQQRKTQVPATDKIYAPRRQRYLDSRNNEYDRFSFSAHSVDFFELREYMFIYNFF